MGEGQITGNSEIFDTLNHGMLKLGVNLRMQELHCLTIAGRTAEKKLLSTQSLTIVDKAIKTA